MKKIVVFLCLFAFLFTIPAYAQEDVLCENLDMVNEIVQDNKEEEIEILDTPNITDFTYWYPGYDESYYQDMLHKAIYNVPSTEPNLCAGWISKVYAYAGLGSLAGDARDQWAWNCAFNDDSLIEDGMIIAVPHSPHGAIGWTYGHVGIIYQNPDFVDTSDDYKEELDTLYKQLSSIKEKYHESNYDRYCTLSSQITDKINEIEKEKEIISKEINGVNCIYDKNGNEKWYVAHNSGSVYYTPLSEWVNEYNVTGEVMWGWGHSDYTMHPQFNYYT